MGAIALRNSTINDQKKIVTMLQTYIYIYIYIGLATAIPQGTVDGKRERVLPQITLLFLVSSKRR